MATTAIPPRLQRPMGFCATPGCSTRANGHCPEHQVTRGRQREALRAPSDARLHTNRWKKTSKRRLALNPWCAGYPSGVHGTQRVLAQCTDHIQPAKGSDDETFWDEANHQSLCQDCNKRKGIAEEGGFGR